MKRSMKTLMISAVVLGVVGGGIFLAMHAALGAREPEKKEDSGPFKVDGETITATAAAIETAGIKDYDVQLSDAPSTLTLSGRTDLDQECVTHVHAQFPGRVVRVGTLKKPLQLGNEVNGPDEHGRGADTLCVIESTDLANAKAAYLQAVVQLELDTAAQDRTEKLFKANVLAPKYIEDAKAAVTKDTAVLDAARQQLRIFGLTDEDMKNISTQQGKERMTYELTSPRSGMIVEKGVVGGELADPTLNLFTIADTSKMWVWGDVYERDKPRVKEGQKMMVILTSNPEHPLECKGGVKWISPVIDANTRSIKIRGELDNVDGHLLAQMYATVIVTVADGKGSIVVPADAVVRKGPQAYVFVVTDVNAQGDKTYRRTKVKVEPIGAGPGLESLPLVDRNTLTRAAGTRGTPVLRVTEGLEKDVNIVRTGALGLFEKMEQKQSQLAEK